MWNANLGTKRARLNTVQVGLLSGAWSTRVDLLNPHRIFGLATQGRQGCCKQWVTSFKIACSVDGISFNTVQDLNTSSTDKVFNGNIDQDTVVNNTLPVHQVCRFVRLLPLTWYDAISLRMELYGTAHVTDVVALGLESGTIPDSSLTASSVFTDNHGPERARLNLVLVGNLRGAWAAKVDLLTPHRIFGLATQGRQDFYPQWVTSFKIACSVDGVSFNNVQDLSTPSTDKVFNGNSDQDTVVNNTLPVPQVCRYIRLLPLTWHGHISLRMELYGTALVTGTHKTFEADKAVDFETKSVTGDKTVSVAFAKFFAVGDF
ncbi:lactadherin-like [Strongylocentrotus purpuratus]|uniref:F5/8 type C domain-containing protein n=1 Tax=Strongylocentrotus purpuratus TaxID=7668 RepID=A0A7M7NIT5_STRPU|nr:lactadherin-like [Strongylocentrotus purpuratus]